MSLTSPWTVVLVAVLAVLYGGIGWEHQFAFKPSDMQRIARAAIEKSTSASPTQSANATLTVAFVLEGLREKYGDLIFENPPWMLNNAGGAMGAMQVLHFSLSEYVIIFGTAVGTEGHTGRFLADDYFTILHGEQWAFHAGSVEKEIFRPGDMHLMSRGIAKQYRMPDECWALEYARGNIVSMLPFGLGDTMSSTMDFVTLYQTLRVAGAGVLVNLAKGKV